MNPPGCHRHPEAAGAAQRSAAATRGESLGLVGGSGCGKSTTARVLTRLAEPTEGRVLLHDAKDEHEVLNVAHLDRDAKRRFRRRVQMIFQDPYESMNPRRSVLDTIAEPLRVQGIGTPCQREEAADAMPNRSA